MNQPASKEPSMDEILSSIRQIIASDDEDGQGGDKSGTATPSEKGADITGTGTTDNAAASAPAPVKANPALSPAPETPAAEQSAADEPLALSAEQIVAQSPSDATDDDLSDFGLGDADGADPGPPEAVVSNDIAFDEAPGEADAPAEADGGAQETGAGPGPDLPAPAPGKKSALAPRAPVARMADPRPEPEQKSPLPDAELTGDIAGSLLEPATNAAARQAFGQLSALGLETNGHTVEDLIRELLRPMLKGWLDENLPSIVERLVQKEIERVSRGER